MECGELSLVIETEGNNTSLASLDKSEMSYSSRGRREATFYKPKHHRPSS